MRQSSATPSGETPTMQPVPQQTMTGRTWLLLVALSLLWAASFLFYKVLGAELPAFTIVLFRVAVGALALVAFLAARGQEFRIPRAYWGRCMVLATLNSAIPFTLFVWAETRISSGTASILNAMTPVFTVLVAGLVLRTERLTAPRLIGVAAGFAGVAVLIGPGALLGQDLVGQVGALAAALSYGFGVPYGKRLAGLSSAQIAVGQLTGATLLLLPLALIVDQPWTLASPSALGWASLFGSALLSTAVAYLLFFRILELAGATNLALVTFLIPVTTLLLGALWLREPITPGALGGMALIAVGLAAIDGRLLRSAFRPA